METAADDKRDAVRDAHSGYGSGVGQGELDVERIRCLKRNSAFCKWAVVDAGAAREDAVFGDEGDQAARGQLRAQKIGVFGYLDIAVDLVSVVLRVVQRGIDDGGNVIAEQCSGLAT